MLQDKFLDLVNLVFTTLGTLLILNFAKQTDDFVMGGPAPSSTK